jgi:hypothetical protein
MGETKSYSVTLPIAGHIHLEIEAASAQVALTKALEMIIPPDADVEWQVLTRFNQGNICYCPSPWEATITNEDGEECDVDLDE